jgi:hypothetical protein
MRNASPRKEQCSRYFDVIVDAERGSYSISPATPFSTSASFLGRLIMTS